MGSQSATVKIVKEGYRNLVACFTSARAFEPYQVSKIRARYESVKFFCWDYGPCDLHDHKRTLQPVRVGNGRPQHLAYDIAVASSVSALVAVRLSSKTFSKMLLTSYLTASKISF